MFSLICLLALETVRAKEIFDVRPSDKTIERALQDPVKNPVFQDGYNNKLVPSSSVLIMGPSNPETAENIPEFLKQFALISAVSGGSAPTGENYNVLTKDLLLLFPGYTDDPNDGVRIHSYICELKQVGNCPEGYSKVNLKNFQDRSIEDISKLSDKYRKKLESKTTKETQIVDENGKPVKADKNDKSEAVEEEE
ncbi:hypothetical protein NUSPORA_01672 [Nucleospora cyclopteri]